MLTDSLLTYEDFKALYKVGPLKYLFFESHTLTSDVTNKPKCLLDHGLVTRAKDIGDNPKKIVAALEELLNVFFTAICKISQDPEALKLHSTDVFVGIWLCKQLRHDRENVGF